jgi:hypothetical protein
MLNPTTVMPSVFLEYCSQTNFLLSCGSSSDFTTQTATSEDIKSWKTAVHTVSSVRERVQNIVTDTVNSPKIEPNLLSCALLRFPMY